MYINIDTFYYFNIWNVTLSIIKYIFIERLLIAI